MHARCTGRYGRQRRFPMFWTTATGGYMLPELCAVVAVEKIRTPGTPGAELKKGSQL
jgi:hypothetical protein